MSGYCQHEGDLDALRERQSATLKIVLAINAVMFLVMVAAALYAGSTAMLSDSLDNLGDALTYALSPLCGNSGDSYKSTGSPF